MLESMLALAQRERLHPDWRAWLASGAPSPQLRALAPAAAAAMAWGAAPLAADDPLQYWLATPVHYFAGLDSVHLHPAGLLQLEDAQQRRLSIDFVRAFAGSNWALQSLQQRELLLLGPRLCVSGDASVALTAADPSAGLPRGPGAARLQRLGSELELWLHEHEINVERQALGELPVTTLWLWGNEPAPGAGAVLDAPADLIAAAPRAARLYGRDTYAEALWRLQASTSLPLPAGFDSTLLQPEHSSIVLLSAQHAEGPMTALQSLERDWVAGALQALRSGRIAGLRLLAGAHAYRLRRRDLWRLWRRSRPWWECLA